MEQTNNKSSSQQDNTNDKHQQNTTTTTTTESSTLSLPLSLADPTSQQQQQQQQCGADGDGFQIIPFAVAIPTPLVQQQEDRTVVVGTITRMGTAVMVWIGWGNEHPSGHNSHAAAAPSTLPTMGPLVMAMPRTKYQSSSSRIGNHDAATAAACSQLIGGPSEEDQMTAWQMATRLSERMRVPVLVSLSLTTNGTSASPMMMEMKDDDVVAQRAAALAEQEVLRILRSSS